MKSIVIRWFLGIFVVLGLVFLPSCQHTPMHGHYYKKKAKEEVVTVTDAYSEEGIASWYGLGFHGRKTASGKRFNTNHLTAAHRTLPFGTKVLVTNLNNDKTVEVEINDRGPAKRTKRLIDLSNAAAKQLGFTSAGTTKVRVEVIEKEDIDG